MSTDKAPLHARSIQHDFAWKLRLTHPDRAELRVEWHGRPVVFDPVAVLPGDLVVLTSAAPDRIRGTAAAVATGARPDVIADPAILEWLGKQGGIGPLSAPGGEVSGVRFDAVPYTAAAQARPVNAFLKASIGALRPRITLAALAESARTAPVEGVQPRAWQLTFPAGRVVHLDLALTRAVSPGWLQSAEVLHGADWLVVGCAYGESDAVATHVGAFRAGQVLVTELVNGERRARGLPTEGVTLLRDRLHAAKVPAHVFATQASYRFE